MAGEWLVSTRFTEDAGVEYPIICGAMYPCSNPELVAAASDAGALGVVAEHRPVGIGDGNQKCQRKGQTEGS